jgi:hypothetical protein
MASLKTSIRLTEDTQKLVQSISPFGQPNWSMGVNQIAHRYQAMVELSLPPLTINESNAFCDAYNGHMFNDDIVLEAKGLMWMVSECIEHNPSFVEHLRGGDTDPYTFYLRVKSWSLVECIAVIHMTQKFWNGQKPIGQQ